MTKFNTHVEKIRPLPDGSGCLLAWFRGYGGNSWVILGLYGIMEKNMEISIMGYMGLRV